MEDASWPGQAYRVVTSANIAAVEEIMKENQHVTEKEIAPIMDISVGSAHHIFYDVLHLNKEQVIDIFEKTE